MRSPALLFILLLCTCVSAQKVDTTYAIIGPMVSVNAYGVEARANVPGPVVEIEQREIRRYDQSSLLSALNRVPGVRFEERATASYRLAIRGASLRAPFGVRNTQVYWNGIPYGDPGGDVPLNFLDAVNIDRVQVIKGPSGGLYGPGTAGTLLLETDYEMADGVYAPKEKHLEASLTAGSYGYFRGDLVAQKGTSDRTYQQFRAGYQRTDGYREHSGMERLTLQFSRKAKNNDRPHTDFHALYTKLDYQLPGGLNAEQFADNPRQARPGSADKNASIHYHNLLLGLTNTQYAGRWKVETALYATGFYFDHPFNFDYKREANLGAGGRVSARRLLRDDLDLVFGVEHKLQYRTGQNFTNPDGTRPGDLNFADEIFSREGLLFGQLRYTPGAWDFSLGLSSSQLDYSIDRTFDADENTGETEFSANRPLSVRLAAGRDVGFGYLYVSRTDGFSPPTLDEFRTNEGSLNVDLDPEVGTNYELGLRTRAGTKFSAEVNVFHFALGEAITSFTDERGTQLFQNAGKTRQNGLELAATYRALNGANDPVDLDFYASYTYYDFTYREFRQRGTDFSGNKVPGAAPHTLNLEVNLALKNGLYLSVFHNFTDAIPLNDANEVFAESFHLLRARLGFRRKGFDVFLAGANLLDERMSFGNDLNPRFGNRYFQPAPGRNWQVGVRKSW